MKLPDFYDTIIVRYSEIALKSDTVRRRLVKILKTHLKVHLSRNDIVYERIWNDYGYIYIRIQDLEIEKTRKILEKVLGVYSFSFCREIASDLDVIVSQIVTLGDCILEKGNTFGIRAKRFGKHNFSSRDVGIVGGDAILERFGNHLGLRVDLENPDVWFYIDARESHTYIYTDIFYTPWAGNPIEYPRGALNWIYSDLSEILSAFMIMKRGIHVLPFLFHSSSRQFPLEVFTRLFGEFKRYLPIQRFFFVQCNLKPISKMIDQILEVSDSKNRHLIQSGLNILLRKYLTNWFIQNQKSVFQCWKSEMEDIHYSNVKTSFRGEDLFVDYRVVTDGRNYQSTVQFIDIFDLHKNIGRIDELNMPVFPATVSFNTDQISTKFMQIDREFAKFSPMLEDYFKNSEFLDISTLDITTIEENEFKNLSGRILKNWEKLVEIINNDLDINKIMILHSL